MAATINTYGGLTSAVTTWLARDGDTDITSRIDDLILLCEQRMYYGAEAIPEANVPAFEAIRIPEMYTANTSFSLSANPIAQPTGLLELVEVKLNDTTGDDEWPLRIVEESIIDSFDPDTTGSPRWIAMSGNNFRVWPDIGTSTYTLTLRYYAALTTPSGSNSTNWILTNTPGVYLNGCLLEAALMTGDFEAAAKYGLLYGAAANGLNARAQRRLAAAQNVRIQLRGRTP